MKRYLALLAGFCLLSPAAALAAANPSGLWEGTLKTPNGDLAFLFNIHRDGDKWAAEMEIPAQTVSVPVTTAKVDGASITLSLPGPGEPRFEGKLSDDGKNIAGKMSQTGPQGAMTLPLDLKWKSEPKAVEKVPANVGEVKVLEGVWEGALDAGGQQLHLRFNFTKNADGTIAATIDSLDQGANGIPVDTISRSADTVKMAIKMIGGAYEGTLNKEATTITGTWTQGGQPGIPLKIERKK